MNETFNYIKKIVEKETGVADISIKSRKREVVEARAVYFKLCRVFLPKRLNSLSNIGESIKKNHATVLHGINLFESFRNKIHFSHYKNAYENCFKILKQSVFDNYSIDDISEIEDVVNILKEDNIRLKKSLSDLRENYVKLEEDNIRIKSLKLTKETLLKVEMLDIDDYKDFLTRANAFLSMDRIKSKYDFLN